MYLYKCHNKPLDSIHILYNLAASEKLMNEIGSERVLTTKTVACLKAALLTKSESGRLQFVLLNKHLKYSEYCEQAKKKLFADAMSLNVTSHILHQGIAVLHSKGTWTSTMSDDINHCHLPLDDPFHPDHLDNNQPTKGKAGGTASKRI